MSAWPGRPCDLRAQDDARFPAYGAGRVVTARSNHVGAEPLEQWRCGMMTNRTRRWSFTISMLNRQINEERTLKGMIDGAEHGRGAIIDAGRCRQLLIGMIRQHEDLAAAAPVGGAGDRGISGLMHRTQAATRGMERSIHRALIPTSTRHRRCESDDETDGDDGELSEHGSLGRS